MTLTKDHYDLFTYLTGKDLNDIDTMTTEEVIDCEFEIGKFMDSNITSEEYQLAYDLIKFV